MMAHHGREGSSWLVGKANHMSIMKAQTPALPREVQLKTSPLINSFPAGSAELELQPTIYGHVIAKAWHRCVCVRACVCVCV